MRTALLSPLLAALCLALAFAAPAFTQAQAADIGEKIPSDLMTQDANGNLRNFKNLAGEKGTILIFYRSAGW